MGLDNVKIDACLNDYILYMKENEKLNECLMCGNVCYKIKDNGVDGGGGGGGE